ncbi:hypothetical protein H696_01237 [Fonticula alba]|uniref:Uncharacterized protein n=1 Tax=Fonticula alba TaxID=691883 RepID=A0A058ZBP6_FONAL|nr:hypothetical protein H696_01237 [Fonticula alba]KCV71819.1 hypothetical protein H696_01237 [Fonticula alba]|eukprot:XP_009493397.1 hypothetical protein H696_01237 [Fonticula alba]
MNGLRGTLNRRQGATVKTANPLDLLDEDNDDLVLTEDLQERIIDSLKKAHATNVLYFSRAIVALSLVLTVVYVALGMMDLSYGADLSVIAVNLGEKDPVPPGYVQALCFLGALAFLALALVFVPQARLRRLGRPGTTPSAEDEAIFTGFFAQAGADGRTASKLARLLPITPFLLALPNLLLVLLSLARLAPRLPVTVLAVGGIPSFVTGLVCWMRVDLQSGLGAVAELEQTASKLKAV